MSNPAAINVVDVWHHFGVRPVLRNVSLRVEPGEAVVIMGPNGMGKSTLLGVIAGLLAPIKGRVEIGGVPRRRSVEDELEIRRNLVYLPDTGWLPWTFTGREFLLAVGRVYAVEEERLMDHCDRLLELFDLDQKADQSIGSYSTGQLKKINICSALITEAPVLVLDEPFSGGLDSSALLALRAVLKRLTQSGEATVVMAVPVPELIEDLADRIALIQDGRILAYESPQGLRRLAGHEGPLPEVIERLVHPQGLHNVERYFEGRL